MDKLKNFIYDKSDLFVALVIIAVAALVIWFGISNIMKPYTGESDAVAQTQTEEPADTTATPEAVTTPEATDNPDAQKKADAAKNASKIIIKSGESSDQIAEKLIAAGAITDKNAFFSKLEELGLASKIQEGTFEIPAGSTLDDVCKIITKTN